MMTKIDIRNLFGWPTCAVCGREVDDVEFIKTVGGNDVVIAKCHGRRELIPVPELDLSLEVPDVRIDNALAFSAESIRDVVLRGR